MEVKVVKLFTYVKEIMETYSYEEVNEKVKENWILLAIVPKSGKYMFSLGRIELK